MSSNTTVLITGANRGVGAGLVQQYLQKPNHTVVAATRDPGHSTSKALQELPKAEGSSLVVVKIDVAVATDAAAAVEELQSSHGIKSLDIVIANAGIAKVTPTVKDTDPSDMLEHFNVNVLGVLYLFQSVLPLLNNSADAKFVTVSTIAATMGGMDAQSFPNAPYGASKAAVNYVTRRMHFEHPEIVVFPIHPGWVQTDMGRLGAQNFGAEDLYKQYSISVEQSASSIKKVVDEATKETTSGQFMSYDGSTIPW